MVKRPEAVGDVALHDPLISAGREMVHLGHRVVGLAPRPEPIGEAEEVLLVNGVQYLGPTARWTILSSRVATVTSYCPSCNRVSGCSGRSGVLVRPCRGSAGVSMACGTDISAAVQRPRGLVRRAAGLRCPDPAMRSRHAASIRSVQGMHSLLPGPRRASSWPASIQS